MNQPPSNPPPAPADQVQVQQPQPQQQPQHQSQQQPRLPQIISQNRPQLQTQQQIQLPTQEQPMPAASKIITAPTPIATHTMGSKTPTIITSRQQAPITLATQAQPRAQLQTPTSGVGTLSGHRAGEYLVLLAPPRQPGVQGVQGVQGLRYPFIPIQRHQMMGTPGATILQRPALIRGVTTQQGMAVHPSVIPTSQSFGIAGVPGAMAATSQMMHQGSFTTSASIAPSQMTPVDALTKGTNFFNTLLTKPNIKAKKSTLQNLIQALLDGKKTSEEFATALQKELCSGPQTQLVPFLDLLLPHLRQSINSGHTKLPGIRAPNMQSQVSGPTIQQEVPIVQSPIMPIISSPMVSVQPQIDSKTPPIATPSPGVPATASPKKKKPVLPPGQKSAYAIKKEAREARKRERELAALNIKAEKVDDKQEPEQKPEKVPKPKVDKPKRQEKQKKQEKQLESLSAALRDDDDVNDVAAMGGVNLAEESQKIMASGAELVGTQIRSCKDEPFLDTKALFAKISRITKEHNLGEPTNDIVTLISHATQHRLKDIVERLGILAEHRIENLKMNSKYEVTNDIKGQVKFLAELDRIEKRRYEEQERELLLRVAKSRTKVEDPEQQKLRQKAKDMQRAEQEEVRQREANQTALLAIGPRKKLKTGSGSSISSFSQTSSLSNRAPKLNHNEIRSESARKYKRVNMRDLQVLFELDRTQLNRLIKITAQ